MSDTIKCPKCGQPQTAPEIEPVRREIGGLTTIYGWFCPKSDCRQKIMSTDAPPDVERFWDCELSSSWLEATLLE